eukprot:3322512-Rhodomonas_salina.1
MQTATKRLLAEGLLDSCRCCLQIHGATPLSSPRCWLFATAHIEAEEKEFGVLVVAGADELVFEVEPAVLDRCAAIVRSSMAECRALRVPMPVKLSVGTSWGSMHDLPDPAARETDGASQGASGREAERGGAVELSDANVAANAQQTSVSHGDDARVESGSLSNDSNIFRGSGAIRTAEERVAAQKEALPSSSAAGTAPEKQRDA